MASAVLYFIIIVERLVFLSIKAKKIGIYYKGYVNPKSYVMIFAIIFA